MNDTTDRPDQIAEAPAQPGAPSPAPSAKIETPAATADAPQVVPLRQPSLAGDAPGLLYRISRAISDRGCDVDLVLISTEGRKAIDVLHVTKQGRKLDDDDQRALRQELVRTLEATYEAD